MSRYASVAWTVVRPPPAAAPLADQTRLGIIAGSLVRAAAGATVLLVRRPDPERVAGER
jgi:hypothetical protein